jgi:hypothetical protein
MTNSWEVCDPCTLARTRSGREVDAQFSQQAAKGRNGNSPREDDSPAYTHKGDSGRKTPQRASHNWFYYAGSSTAEGSVIPGVVREVSTALGRPSSHRDDWEGN